MQTISSSQYAFLTALYVPVVPLLQWLFLRRPPGLMSWLGIVLAFTGLLLVAGPQDGRITLNAGEIATLISTLAIAAEIILISRYAGKVDVRRVTLIQLAVASLCAWRRNLTPGLAVAHCHQLSGSHCRRSFAGAGCGQRPDSGHHELGATQRFADPRYGDLCRGTSLGWRRGAYCG